MPEKRRKPPSDYFIPILSPEEISRERSKARELRASQWWKRKKAQGICHYCGGKFKPSDLTMDHIVPLIRGGRSTKGNVATCCKECNNKKKHRLLMEWEDYTE
jgi:5-methylcytosine-specific restriction endonuclease McrA